MDTGKLKQDLKEIIEHCDFKIKYATETQEKELEKEDSERDSILLQSCQTNIISNKSVRGKILEVLNKHFDAVIA